MKLSPIEFSTGDTTDIATFLADRIYEFNADATGLRDGDVFAATITDDAGAIVAGVNGHTWGGCCHVANLWVRRSLRGWGLGARLVAAVETHARSKDCTQIVLSSHTFQAPDFYRKLGFVEQARIPGYPNGHADIHFMKFLGTADA